MRWPWNPGCSKGKAAKLRSAGRNCEDDPGCALLKQRKFRFSKEITSLSVIAALLCYTMAYWQFTRYKNKRAYEDLFARQSLKARVPLGNWERDWSAGRLAKVFARGELDYEHEVVLINRSKGHISGVKLITPLRIPARNERILVDRGFFPYDRYARRERGAAQPEGERLVEGRLHPSQKAQFFLAPPMRDPQPGEWKERWLRLDIEKMAKQLPYPVLPVYLEQINQSGDYPVHDPKGVLPSGRHLNYAIQWFSFGSFSWLFALFLQFRRRRPGQTAASHREIVPGK